MRARVHMKRDLMPPDCVAGCEAPPLALGTLPKGPLVSTRSKAANIHKCHQIQIIKAPVPHPNLA